MRQRFRRRVRAAFFAAPERSRRVRFRAAVRVWRRSDCEDPALRRSRRSARVMPRERFADGFRLRLV
ncbi:MAG: hypothetical protein ACREQY_04545, partial [Candidatus Binatia bacterium]